MPYYLFTNEIETKEIFFHMNDNKEYSENGVKWRRVFLSPQSSIDSKINPDNPKDFVEKTRNKKGTLGNLWDLSKELSIKRGGNSGVDRVKEKYYTDYEKNVKKPHIHKIRQKAAEKLEKMGVSIS